MKKTIIIATDFKTRELLIQKINTLPEMALVNVLSNKSELERYLQLNNDGVDLILNANYQLSNEICQLLHSQYPHINCIYCGSNRNQLNGRGNIENANLYLDEHLNNHSQNDFLSSESLIFKSTHPVHPYNNPTTFQDRFNEKTMIQKLFELKNPTVIDEQIATPTFKNRFLIQAGDKIIYKTVKETAYFYAEGKSVYLGSAEKLKIASF